MEGDRQPPFPAAPALEPRTGLQGAPMKAPRPEGLRAEGGGGQTAQKTPRWALEDRDLQPHRTALHEYPSSPLGTVVKLRSGCTGHRCLSMPCLWPSLLPITRQDGRGPLSLPAPTMAPHYTPPKLQGPWHHCTPTSPTLAKWGWGLSPYGPCPHALPGPVGLTNFSGSQEQPPGMAEARGNVAEGTWRKYVPLLVTVFGNNCK